jgi:hypothetical protein
VRVALYQLSPEVLLIAGFIVGFSAALAALVFFLGKVRARRG